MQQKNIISNEIVKISEKYLKIKDVHYVDFTLSSSHRNPIIPRSNAITPS